MSELPLLLLAVVVGALAGGIFFGGLWYTVSHLPVVSKPKLFFLQSYLLRTVLVLLLLYFSTKFDLLRVAGYSAGFLIMRIILVRYLANRE
ncbi:MAG: hypothetical protein EOL98_00245 [Negativicutes bacterium]|nr:hypothetical protein [Negativicutes bacterium]